MQYTRGATTLIWVLHARWWRTGTPAQGSPDQRSPALPVHAPCVPAQKHPGPSDWREPGCSMRRPV